MTNSVANNNKAKGAELVLTPFRAEQAGTVPEETLAQLNGLHGLSAHLRDAVDLPRTVELRQAGKIAKGDFVITVRSTVQCMKDQNVDVRARAALFGAQSGVAGKILGALLVVAEHLPGIAQKAQALDDNFAGIALSGLFIKAYNKGMKATDPDWKDVDYVPLSSMAAVGPAQRGGTGLRADSGSLRKENGDVDPKIAAAFFLDIAGRSVPGGGMPKTLYATEAGLAQYYASGDFPGKVLNALEFSLAMDLYGETRTDGTKILTAENWVKFWTGRPMADRMAATALAAKTGQDQRIPPALMDAPLHTKEQLAAALSRFAAQGGLHVNAGTCAAAGAQSVYSPEALAAYDKSYGIDPGLTANDQSERRTLANQLGTAVIRTPVQNLVMHILGKATGNMMGCPAMKGSVGAPSALPEVKQLGPGAQVEALKKVVFGPPPAEN